jgi:hypothetical protein
MARQLRQFSAFTWYWRTEQQTHFDPAPRIPKFLL